MSVRDGNEGEGTMLGYDRIQQCQRLLKRKRLKAKEQEPLPIALSRAS